VPLAIALICGRLAVNRESPKLRLCPARPDMNDRNRLIAHLDMDAFYASVELLRHPELRGRPVVIGGGRRRADDPQAGAGQRFPTLREYVGRGVATTATYEARALGVNSGMGLMKAARLAPDAIRLPADFDAYQRYSKLFKAAVRAIAPEIENRGIDEIYIDLTDVKPPSTFARDGEGDDWKVRARALAQSIKAAVRSATGLSSSIGLAPNKLLAKIASDLDKPDGITIVTAADVAPRIWPLPARRINGIGPKASARLEGLGIRTIGELAHADPQWLVQNFGHHYGVWMHEAANGRDLRPVVTRSEPRSISRETTLDRDLDAVRDRAELSQIFTDLCTHVAEDLRRAGYAGRTIGLKLRFDNFYTVTRDRTIPAPTQDAQAIRRAAGECLKRVPLERRIRLLGVKVAALTPGDGTGDAPEPSSDPTLELF
jgi:DNA polymerase-4